MKQKLSLWDIFWTFFKIGAFTFGGGLAMMPVMRREVVHKKNWVDDEEILKILVISESTPGVFAVNSATFIGYKLRKFMGSLVATLGVVLPSLITISFISLFIIQFREIKWVSYMFSGIQVGVAILIFKAALSLSKKLTMTLFTGLILAIVFLLALFTNINIIILIFLSALAGVVFHYFLSLKEAKQHVA